MTEQYSRGTFHKLLVLLRHLGSQGHAATPARLDALGIRLPAWLHSRQSRPGVARRERQGHEQRPIVLGARAPNPLGQDEPSGRQAANQ